MWLIHVNEYLISGQKKYFCKTGNDHVKGLARLPHILLVSVQHHMKLWQRKWFKKKVITFIQYRLLNCFVNEMIVTNVPVTGASLFSDSMLLTRILFYVNKCICINLSLSCVEKRKKRESCCTEYTSKVPSSTVSKWI